MCGTYFQNSTTKCVVRSQRRTEIKKGEKVETHTKKNKEGSKIKRKNDKVNITKIVQMENISKNLYFSYYSCNFCTLVLNCPFLNNNNLIKTS